MKLGGVVGSLETPTTVHPLRRNLLDAHAATVLMIASKATTNIGLPSLLWQLIGGSVLGGIVWKFFKRVETLLTDRSKLEIARWLRAKTVESDFFDWSTTFGNIFDQVYGTKHFSWCCFLRSASGTYFALFGWCPNLGHYPFLPCLCYRFYFRTALIVGELD
jgi:hypothetical protein